MTNAGENGVPSMQQLAGASPFAAHSSSRACTRAGQRFNGWRGRGAAPSERRHGPQAGPRWRDPEHAARAAEAIHLDICGRRLKRCRLRPNRSNSPPESNRKAGEARVKSPRKCFLATSRACRIRSRCRAKDFRHKTVRSTAPSRLASVESILVGLGRLGRSLSVPKESSYG